MATIRKRVGKNGVSWQVAIRRKGFDPIYETFSSLGRARAWAAETEAAMDARKYRDPRLAEAVTLAEALEMYNERVSTRKAASTRAREQDSMAALLRGLGADISLADISPAVAARYRDERLRSVSAYTVRQELALLSHMFRVAGREWELPVENPVAQIDRPAPPQGRTRFLTLDEARRLVQECAASRNRMLLPFVLLLLQTGMRPSEAAGLRWGQIEDGRTVVLHVTKTGRPRRVPLTAATAEALRSIRPDDACRDTPVFLSPEKLSRGIYSRRPSAAFRESFDAARRRAGIADVRMYDLRHTAATWMLARGVDIRIIADICGHRTLQMALRYTHPDDEVKREAIETLEDLGL